jgi:hypothetical protein
MFRRSTVASSWTLQPRRSEIHRGAVKLYRGVLGVCAAVPFPAKLDSTTTLHEMQSRMLTQLPASARKMAWIPDPLGGGAP